MEDERKTLLKFEGDASGAKQAAAETKQSLQEVGQSVRDSQEKAVQSAQSVTGDLKKQEDGAVDTSKAFDTFAKSLGTTAQEAAAARQVLARVSPELSILIDLAMKARSAIGFIFSPLGAVAAGAAAMFAVVTLAITDMRETAKRAREEFERVIELNRQVKRDTRGRTEEVADVMARAGLVSEEAVGKGRAIEEGLKRKGFKQEAIRPVLPYAVTEAGEQAMTDEQLEALVTREEFEPGGLAFKGPREMPSALRAQQRRIERDHELNAKRRQAVAARVDREQRGIAQQDRDVIGERLRREEGVPEEQIERDVTDVLNVVNKGRVIDPTLEATKEEHRMEFQRRQMEAARRAQSMGLIGSERMRDVSEATLVRYDGSGPRSEQYAGPALAAKGIYTFGDLARANRREREGANQPAEGPAPGAPPIPPASVTAPTPAGGQALVEDPETGEFIDTEELETRRARRTIGRGLGAVRRGPWAF